MAISRPWSSFRTASLGNALHLFARPKSVSSERDSGRASQHGLFFIRYNGTLTYPPCKPNVTWYVFTEPVILARHLSKYLYQLNFESHYSILGQFTVTGNSRPALKHYTDRTVLRSFAINDNIIRLKENKAIFDRMMHVLVSPKYTKFLHASVQNMNQASIKTTKKKVELDKKAQKIAYNENWRLNKELLNLSRSKIETQKGNYNFTNRQKIGVKINCCQCLYNRIYTSLIMILLTNFI